MNNKEWLYIVQQYQENSIHFDRLQICYDLILNLFKSVKLKRTSIISNSLILYHKYYIYNLFTNSNLLNKLNDNNDNKDLKCISIACFFLSLKITNYLLQIDFLLDIIYKNNNLEVKNSDEKIIIKNMVLKYESDILFSINFDLEHDLPYIYIKNLWGDLSNKILEYLNNNKNNNINKINNNFLNNEDDTSKIKLIKDNISEILNYSFLFPFFLYYNSKIIALSCLNLALKKFNKKSNIIDIISNHIEMKNISINDIEICSSLIDEIILSRIRKKSNEEQINNINNISLHDLIPVNHNKEANNETKLKLTNNIKKNEIYISNNQK